MKKALILFLSTFTLTLSAQVKFFAKADKTNISLDDVVKLEFIFESEGNYNPQIQFPAIKNFRIVGRQSVQNSSIVGNDRVKTQKGMIVFLKPIKEGKLKIDKATLYYNGKEYYTKPITISVGNSSGITKTKKDITKPVKKNTSETFLELSTNNSSPYLNEAIQLELILYTRNPDKFVGGRNNILPPNFVGFTVEPIKNISTNSWSYTYKNGLKYAKVVVSKYLLFPSIQKDIVIKPFTIELEIPYNYWDKQKVKYDSNPLKVSVTKLPGSQPKSFKGAVGQFSINVFSNKQQLKHNEAVNIEIELVGSGNLKTISAPELIAPNEVELYPPKEREHINTYESGMKGKVVNQQIAVPLYGGNYQLQTQPFTYFDPTTQQYVTLRSDPIKLNITGPKPPENLTVKSENKNDKKGKSILNEADEQEDEMVEKFKNWGIVGFGSVIVLSSLLFLFVYRKKQKSKIENDNLEVTDQPIKNEIKTDDLNLLAKESNSSEFFDLLDKKINLLKENLTNTEIKNSNSNIDLDDINNDLNELKSIAQIQKYSPIQNNNLNLQDYLVKFENILKKTT